KIAISTIVSSSVGLFISSAGFLAYDAVQFRRSMIEETVAQARIIAVACLEPIVFSDERAAAGILSAFSGRSDLLRAGIYTPDGSLFAEYEQSPEAEPLPSDAEIGYHFKNGLLHMHYPMELNGKPIGTLILLLDQRRLYRRLVNYSVLVAILMISAAGISFLVSARMRRWITEPISQLHTAMVRVSTEKDYSLRVTKSSD